MERQIEEIVKIICPVYKDGAKCTFNERQFGERKCADPCTVRTTAKMLIEAGLRPEVHGQWIPYDREIREVKGYAGRLMYTHPLNFRCSICNRISESQEPYCHCGAKMDGGMNNG